MNKLLKFYASWCGSCEVLGSTLEELDIPYENIDIESENGVALANHFRVYEIPALVLVNEEGDELRKITGLLSKEKIKEFVYKIT